MPVNPTLNTRKLGNVTYVARGRESLDLDRDGVLYNLALHLKFTVTSGSSGPADPLFQTLARLIRRVEVIVAGRDTVQSVPGWYLALAAKYYAKGLPAYGMDSAIVTTGSSTATEYEVILPVDFTLPTGKRPDDTGLPTSGLTQLALHVTWGDAADLFGTANGAAVSNVTCEVTGEYMLYPTMADTPVYFTRALTFQEEDLTATNTEWAITVDNRTGITLTSLMVAATVDNVGNDDIIRSAILRAGSFTYTHADAPVVKARNQRRLELTPEAGVLYIDPRYNGQIVNGIDTRPSVLPSDLKLVLDASKQSGTNKVTIVREGVRSLLL